MIRIATLALISVLAVSASSVTVMAGAPPPASLPDGGSTALLAVVAGFGVTAMRRFIARSK